MKTFKEESIEIIESLLDTISWLGGDAYEVECAENMTKEAYEFLAKHKPVPVIIKKDRYNSSNGLYCLIGNETIKTEAVNKRSAANIFHVEVSRVKCLVIPGTPLKVKS